MTMTGPGAAKKIVEALIRAVAEGDEGGFEKRVADHAVLRLWRWDGHEIHRPRQRLYRRLADEWAAWDRPVLEIQRSIGEDLHGVVEFRVLTTEGAEPVEHSRVMIASLEGERVSSIDLHCARAIRCGAHMHYNAGNILAIDNIDRQLMALRYPRDTRLSCPASWEARYMPRITTHGTGVAHPNVNRVAHARFSADEADARIAEIIESYRERDIGFSWHLGPYDTPSDLAERLQKHGMVYAGSASILVRELGPCDDIPINPEVEVQAIDPGDDETIEAVLQMIGIAFQWPKKQIDDYRLHWFDTVQNPAARKYQEPYVARLDGANVAFASLTNRVWLASLDGAATLPGYRGRGVYSTLLRYRIERARELGYGPAVIEAMPMSRRVAERYGFKERGQLRVYAWMPVIDMDVIRTIIQTDDNQPDCED